jgi:hypothetical protein
MPRYQTGHEGGILGAQIGQDFAHDIAVTRFLEIGRDHVPGIGQGGVPGEPQLFGRPQSEQFVATGRPDCSVRCNNSAPYRDG